MKTWRASRCFLMGHRLYEPTTGVAACQRCNDARKWGQPGWSQREAEGLLLYPWSRLKGFVVGHFRKLRAHLFCHHCGRIVFHRVDKHFCSKKCGDEWFPF